MGSIEVRLLGRLQVRRADGTMVDNAEWRTGKTADLVRLLTLAAGRPARVDSLLETLWPGAEEAKPRRIAIASDGQQQPQAISA